MIFKDTFPLNESKSSTSTGKSPLQALFHQAMLKRRQSQLSKECTCGDLQQEKLHLFVILKYFMNPTTIIQNLASIGKIEVLLKADNGNESIITCQPQVKAHRNNQ